jgi:catechol 2,3-dioxygenase-like lactoylglutathione lyase family enzyme
VPDPSLHHVGVTVSDLNRAVDFYTDTFDLTIVTELAVGGVAFAEAVDVAGASAAFTHLDGDGTRVELVEFNPQGAALLERTLNRPGTAHLGLAVDDVETLRPGERPRAGRRSVSYVTPMAIGLRCSMPEDTRDCAGRSQHLRTR